MNKYEQLQKFLNKCIALGWKPRNLINEYYIYVTDRITLHTDEKFIGMQDFGFHELFSKDSGLMEFVKWEHDSTINQITVHWVTIMDYDVKYNYMIMSEMTSDEKVTYFLENALLPNKQD